MWPTWYTQPTWSLSESEALTRSSQFPPLSRGFFTEFTDVLYLASLSSLVSSPIQLTLFCFIHSCSPLSCLSVSFPFCFAWLHIICFVSILPLSLFTVFFST